MTVYINGMLQNECSGTDRTGYIALQSEGGTLEFRNVYLHRCEIGIRHSGPDLQHQGRPRSRGRPSVVLRPDCYARIFAFQRR